MSAKESAPTLEVFQPIGMRMEFSPDGGHWYYCNGEGPLPGATSITALQEAIGGTDGLMNWGINIAVTKALAVMAETADAEKARSEAWQAKNAPRDLGSAVHKAIEAVNLGAPLVTTPDTAPFVAQYAAFLARYRPEIVAAEQMVANTSLRFGGSFDLLARIDGRLALIDVKTGKSRPSHRLQLAGYSMAEYTGREGAPVEDMPPIEAAYVLLLRADGYEPVPYEITDADRAHFRRLVETFHEAQQWREAAA